MYFLTPHELKIPAREMVIKHILSTVLNTRGILTYANLTKEI